MNVGWAIPTTYFPIHTLLSIHTYFFPLLSTILNCMWAIVYFYHAPGTRRFCCRMLWNVPRNVNWKTKKQAQMKWNYLNIVLMISGARTREVREKKQRIQTNEMKEHEKKPIEFTLRYHKQSTMTIWKIHSFILCRVRLVSSFDGGWSGRNHFEANLWLWGERRTKQKIKQNSRTEKKKTTENEWNSMTIFMMTVKYDDDNWINNWMIWNGHGVYGTRDTPILIFNDNLWFGEIYFFLSSFALSHFIHSFSHKKIH